MPTLSSILVQRGAASMRAVEDAIARQVFHGGDLATNLLELGALREEVLGPLVAESVGLAPAPPGRLALPSADVRSLVPGELAMRHGIFPLAVRDRALVVAVAEPLAPAVEDDLGFALDLAIRQLVAPLVRIRQAIADSYGIPLDRRFLRLQAKLDGRADPSPSAIPPAADHGLFAMKMPRGVSIPSPSFGTGVPGSDDLEPGRLEALPTSKTPYVARPEAFFSPAIPRSPALPVLPVLDGGAPPQTPGLGGAAAASSLAFDGDAAPEPPAFDAVEASGSAAPEEPTVADSVRSAKATRALAGVLRQALREERATAPVDKTTGAATAKASPWRAAQPRRKGPFTTAMAELELEEATTSDDVLAILFSFAHQFFEYSALFVVHGDIAEGRDASGPGADRARMAGIGVPLDVPSGLALAREHRGPVIGPLVAEGVDVDLLLALGREPRSPARAAALLPVCVRTRTVAIIYGDDGDANVSLSALGDVLALIGLAGAAFERIALRKKLGSRAPEIPLKVRIQDGAAALARAISASAADVRAFELGAPLGSEPSSALATMGAPLDAASSSAPKPPQGAVDAGGEPVAMFASSEPLGDFGVAPPVEENPLAIAPGPRTTRYFEEPPTGHRAPTQPGIGIPFPEGDDAVVREASALDWGDAPPPPPAPTASAEPVRMGITPTPPAGGRAIVDRSVEARAATEAFDGPPDTTATPAAPVLDSWMPAPVTARTEVAVAAPPSRKSSVVRRGPAPHYQGRNAAVPEGASVEWIGGPASADEEDDGDASGRAQRERARTLPSMVAIGFEPLPRTPPPNATAWTSFPSPPPPPSLGMLSKQRPPSNHPPIPREEESDRPSPFGDGGGFDARSRLQSGAPLPSVMVDVAAEHKELIQRVVDGGYRGQEAFDELVRNGEHIIQAVMARFPGPLRVDRHRARGELPAASQCGPILELVVAIRRPALPFISVRTSSPDAEVRFWATHALGELRYAEAATVLVPRLFDDDAPVRRIARRSAAALVGAGAAGGPILKGLEDITRNADQPIPHRVLAIETMGEIRSGSLVPPLLSALDDASDEVSDAARRALLLITRQDFGRSSLRWGDWWARNEGRNRIEWLIDALMHEQPSVRRAAGDELKLLTKEYFGYYDDLPKRERERAQGLYRTWWDREGRPRFA